MEISDEQRRDVRTTIVNVDQARAWDGEEGDRWVEQEERYDATVHRYGIHLLHAARISAQDHVLDIGCGCGESTRQAGRAAASGMALGMDLSSRMLNRARERSRAEGLSNVEFVQADAQVYPFEAEAFDLAISRFGAMFFSDRVAAFRNIAGALRPGGRLVLLSWQALRKNRWMMTVLEALAVGRPLPEPPADAPGGPFGLADADAVRWVLTEAGFHDIDLQEISEPVYLGADGEDAFEFARTLGISKGMLDGLDDIRRAQALDALRTTLAERATGEGVLVDSCAWLITTRRP